MDSSHAENELSKVAIGAAIEVHRILGPGLLESVYERALVYELGLQGVLVQSQVVVPVQYKGAQLGESLRLDLLLDERLVVEIKAVKEISDLHRAQLLSYLRLSQKKLGLILNFHCKTLREGIERVVNRL